MEIERGGRVLRVVVDAVQQCNLRCLYCHPGEVWHPRHVHVGRLAGFFSAVEQRGLLELVLSGGEVTLHPRLGELLEATSVLDRTAVTVITNATRVTDGLAQQFQTAGLTRVCVSLDGADDETHSAARGDNRRRVLAGLERIRATGLPVTVISVVHQGNVAKVLRLSEWLADTAMADQHHMCAPSYSGEAKGHYGELRLCLDDYFRLQRALDGVHDDLVRRGLFVTFNSFWPATGQRSPVVDGGRRITLQQVSEQVKDTLVHLRPDGEVRLTAASWGRETVGNATVGNVYEEDPAVLLARAEAAYGEGSVGQLPREVEARHKFQIGAGADTAETAVLITSRARPETLTDLIPIRPLSHLSLLENPLTSAALDGLAQEISLEPSEFRLVRHPCGVGMVFDRRRSHVTLLRDDEWPRVTDRLADGVAVPT